MHISQNNHNIALSKLAGVKIVVVEVFLEHKRLMGALLHHITVIRHQDVINVLDGGQPVGDDEAGLVCHQGADRLLHLPLSVGGHVGGSLVQNQHTPMNFHPSKRCS